MPFLAHFPWWHNQQAVRRLWLNHCNTTPECARQMDGQTEFLYNIAHQISCADVRWKQKELLYKYNIVWWCHINACFMPSSPASTRTLISFILYSNCIFSVFLVVHLCASNKFHLICYSKVQLWFGVHHIVSSPQIKNTHALANNNILSNKQQHFKLIINNSVAQFEISYATHQVFNSFHTFFFFSYACHLP